MSTARRKENRLHQPIYAVWCWRWYVWLCVAMTAVAAYLAIAPAACYWVENKLRLPKAQHSIALSMIYPAQYVREHEDAYRGFWDWEWTLMQVSDPDAKIRWR